MKLKTAKIRSKYSLVLLVAAGLIWSCSNQQAEKAGIDGAQLESGFVTPPDSAKPRVWWHWMNGNITKEGIRADLEWMHRAGIGGFQNFDAGLSSPQVVDQRLIYMTPEWKDAFAFTTSLADSLGLEMAIAGSPGWSESGGPWVKPEEAMKKYVWSQVRLEGGKAFNGKLPQPPSVAGPFQNIGMEPSPMGHGPEPSPDYYADAAVIAYRLPETDLAMAELSPTVTSSGGQFSLAELTDGDLATSSFLPAGKEGQASWIQFEFDEPVSMQALTIVGGGMNRMFGPPEETRALESSMGGRTFEKVLDIPASGLKELSVSFPATTAKYFRFAWTKLPNQGPPAIPGLPMMNRGPQGPAGTQVAELVLSSAGRVHRFEDKAAFEAATDLYQAFTPTVDAATVVPKTDVIDLTDKMEADGSLNWTPPAGKWMVVRLGYSLTGHKNGPASPEATGLEVDKLSAKHVNAYFTNYLDQYKDATGGLMGQHGLQFVITDSWEAGTQNWTDDMISEFKKRRGYDMLPWFPVLTGQIVESAEASDRFLWDFRKTLADLVTENHYDQLTKLLAERGMGRYSESHEARRAFIGDGMEAKRSATVPMGAGWTPGGFGGNEGGVASFYQADIRESASVAHLYGQDFVAAESLTAMGSDYAWSPERLKPIADHLMACGLNRFVIHTSVHQPLLDRVPGMSLGPFGQWFTRNETWAEQAIAWTTYLSRSCFMLQQGEFVADIAYYYGEDNNITTLFSRLRGGDLPTIPEGYNYDFINADALVNLLMLENGLLTTPSGMSYRVLALDPNSQYMTLTVLRKVKALVEAGAVVAGPKPMMTPSLSDDPAEFEAITSQLWANESGVNVVGKGRVYPELALAETMTAENIQPDFAYTKPEEDSNLFYLHRKAGENDIYWVNNRSSHAEDLEATFRVSGKEAEIWHPETGKIEKVSFQMAGEATTVPLKLEPEDAYFVVFRTTTTAKEYKKPEVTENQLAMLEGPWTVNFQADRGAPSEVTFEALSDWTDNVDMGIKYFSGTASYHQTISVPAEWLVDGAQLWIDLGQVKNLAEVVVNGESQGIVWKTPFRLELSKALKEGENQLEIKVTNLWVNRLIGDQQPGVTEPVTWSSNPFYKADSPLFSSGLLGPVSLISRN
ncbi:glycosyl hydrolase [Mangrovibacterium lignilyticum]|uniref:glycosyl hydrolase n=1 Tax=Mangrovibacterium lignilyticum TaxID=2668052 RepID=UPI0013D4D427|nr:glycosyl hydrolase [Mangrovibacterium lignilyticum]